MTFALVVYAERATAGPPNFGYRYVTNACCELRGTRAQIKSPNYNLKTTPAGYLAIMRVIAQGNDALIQTGFGTAPQQSFGACGTRSANTVFWEQKISGGGYTCQWLGTFGATPTNKKYSVVRSSNCSTCWCVFVDGSLQYSSGALGFSAAYQVYAGGEFNAGPPGTPGGTAYGCYGCDGQTPWQRTSQVYGGTWTIVQSANAVNTDGQWSVGSPPSPFSISH